MARGLPKLCKMIAAEGNKKAPVIFTAIGLGLLTASVIFAVKESKKAEERKQELKEHDVELKKFDYLKALIPCYKKTISSFAGGMAFVVSGSYISIKRLAKAVVAEEVTRKAYNVTRKAIHDVVGEDSARKIDEKVAENYNPDATLKGTILIKDDTLGGTFRMSIYDLLNGVNEANEILIADDELSCNSWLDIFGRDSIDIGDKIGYSKRIDPNYRIEVFPNSDPSSWETDFDVVTGEPCLVFRYSDPWEGYDKNF